MKNLKLFLLLTGAFIIQQSFAQSLLIDTSMAAINQYMEDGLSENPNHIAFSDYFGNPNSIAYFQIADSNTNFPFQEGILLSTGYAKDACGPNNTDSASGLTDGGYNSLLSDLLSDTIFDAAVFEFTYTPFSDTIEIKYIFASEEYPEHIDSSWNDGFGIFISGPGFPGEPGYQNYNIATLPGTSSPISINTINAGINDSFYLANTQNANEVLQFDGNTVPLVAKACVVHGVPIQIKIIVGDVGNSAYDSAVFIGEIKSISPPKVTMTNTDQYGHETNEIIEGNSYDYVFSRLDTTDLSSPQSVTLGIGGTASCSWDISGFPSNFWIPAGQVSTNVYFTVTADEVLEGIEYFIFRLVNSGCGCQISNEEVDTIWIIDSNLNLESLHPVGQLNVYPNPVNSKLRIKGKGIATVSYEIYSMNGALILLGKLKDDESQIDITELPSGTYSIRLRTRDHFVSKQFDVFR